MANDEVPPYEKARDITEKALEAYKDHDDKQGDKLIQQAKKVDEAAVKDVHEELEEDASSEHDPAKLNARLAKSKND